jgi:hypothetical protein
MGYKEFSLRRFVAAFLFFQILRSGEVSEPMNREEDSAKLSPSSTFFTLEDIGTHAILWHRANS